jgi:hypothetical protein
MNIREIKKAIIENQQWSSSEVVDYINQRLERRNNPTYRKRLFRIINPALNRLDWQVFYCEYHEQVECEERSNIIRTNCDDLICVSSYTESYFTCDDCEEVFQNDDVRTVDGRSLVYCEACYEANTRYCDVCDTDYHCEDFCDCDEERESEESNLDEWNTRNEKHFHGKENSILFYGGECELQVYRDQNRNDVVSNFRDCFNLEVENVICKRDGSLDSEKGFEMSTTPCSFDYHKEIFWNAFFELKPAQYCKAYEGHQCGIHWHFNRNAFTENQLKRLNCFYNHPKNKNLIVDVAGRNENNYCRFVPSITFDCPIKTDGDAYKYRVINFNNINTVEVRIFRSNLKQISFFRYLEFVHTVNQWIRSTDQNDAGNITWEYYFDWLLKNIDKKFSNLFLFLDDKKHFDHLENIQEWETVYTDFKTVIHDFRNNNQELIQQESEE